jgi:hypothetical protein
MTKEADVQKLIENIVFQAESYLKEFGEFFPFGSTFETNGIIRPVSVYFGDNHPAPSEVLSNLESALKQAAAKNKYIAVAIATDVITSHPVSGDRIEAIEIKADHKESYRVNYYLPYKINEDGSILFFDAFSVGGTLNIFG